jgi:hypothetical protein
MICVPAGAVFGGADFGANGLGAVAVDAGDDSITCPNITEGANPPSNAKKNPAAQKPNGEEKQTIRGFRIRNPKGLLKES